MSASSWTSPVRWKERARWSPGRKNGEAGGRKRFFWSRRRIHGSQREGGPLVSSGKDNEGSEEVKGAENEEQGSKMEVDETTPHEASAEVQAQKEE